MGQVATAVDFEIDPDIEQAIDDLWEVAGSIREWTASLVRHRDGSWERKRIEQRIRDYYSRIELRAERIATISAPALLELINARITAKSRRGRGEPARVTSRVLRDRLIEKIAEETSARRMLAEAQERFTSATAARVAAEEACAAAGLTRDAA
ncbi:MAG: hypothetical protein ACTHOJ_01905 [Sphingomonas oligoaromativorans]